MTKPVSKRLLRVVAGVAALALSEPASPQSTYPDRAVHIVVPYASGGSTDGIARACADWLTRRIGGPFIVENRAGASGAIAAKYVASAQPDGYVLLVAATPQLAILPNMTKIPFDPLRDFAPISIVSNNAQVLVVNNTIPVASLAQFVEYVKARPGKLAYASAGSGSLMHLSMALFAHQAGLDLVHVSYKGGAPAISDVVGGQLHVAFGNPSDVLPQVRAGKLRALAVSSSTRLPNLPEVPTAAEQGFPGFKINTWNGFVAPARTPKPIIARIAAEITAASGDQNYVGRLRNIGVEAAADSPDEFARRIRDDLKSWAEIVRISGATME